MGATCYRLPRVNLFASGVYRGRRWTPADVRQMAENAAALGKLIVPPAAPGHEDDDGWQEYVPTDLPAAGWVLPASVKAVPDPAHPGEMILVGDVVNIPPEMKAKLDSGEYRFGSSEIYDDFTDDFGKSRGKVLRKFSYLGGEVPQVKRLGPLPKPVPMAAPLAFSERRPAIRQRRVRRGTTVLTFAETVMDRQQMIAAIQAAMPGIAQATLDAMPDDALADLVKNLPSPAAPAAGPAAFADVPREQMIADLVTAGQDAATLEAMPEDELAALYEEVMGAGGGSEVETMGDPATMSREELIAELTAAGEDPAALEAMPEEELRAKYASLAGATPPAPAVAAMSERVRRTLANVNRLNTFAELQLRRLKANAAEMKRAKVNTFCEKLVREGKLFPAQLADYKSLLGSLDDVRPVHRFAEGGRVTKVTALDKKMRELAARAPVIRFGEKLPGGGVGGRTTEAVEVSRVTRFAETHATALRAGGMTPEQYVEKFSELRKKKPTLTAREFGVPAEFCN